MSTTRERLDLGVDALRDATATRGDGGATRSLILNRLARQRRRRRTYEVVLLGLLLLIAVPAISAGWKYMRLAADAPNKTTQERAKTTAALRARPAAPPPLAAAASQAPPASDEPAAVAPATPLSPIPPSMPSSASAPRPHAQLDELDVYGRAHETHFHAHDLEKALRLWTDYVVRYPHGRFVPEAEFNRAVCLVRLGDPASARRILIKLADAASPDYPKREAERLLATLR